MYSAGGRCTALAASGDVVGHIWNPSGNEAITVHRIEVHNTSAVGMFAQVSRTTSAGTTPGQTVTPDLDNHFGRRAAPSSTPVLYMGNFATEPTKATPGLSRWGPGAFLGSPMVWDFSSAPITVPPNSGLGVEITSATAPLADMTVFWEPGSSGVGDAFWVGGNPDGLAAAEAAWTTLWNPSSDIALHVFFISFGTRSTEAVDYTVRLVRATARGTQSATTTPDADNHVEQLKTPASGAVLDTGYTVDPTMDTDSGPLFQWQQTGRATQSGVIWQIPTDDENGIDLDDCIVVPPGTGLTIRRDVTGATTTKEVTFGWYE